MVAINIHPVMVIHNGPLKQLLYNYLYTHGALSKSHLTY